MSIPIQELINKSLRSKKRKKKEITSWHISKIGSCMRGTYLQRLGHKPDKEIDDRTLRIFDIGNKIEDWVVDLLKSQKGVIVETQTRVEDLKLNVSGYSDVIVQYNGEKVLYEIKSKNSRAFTWMDKKGEGANRHHEYQIWMYLKLLGLDKGNIIYISKDDMRVLEYPVMLANKSLEQEVMSWLDTMNKCWEKRELPPLPDKNAWQSKWCNYHKQCTKGLKKIINKDKKILDFSKTN